MGILDMFTGGGKEAAQKAEEKLKDTKDEIVEGAKEEATKVAKESQAGFLDNLIENLVKQFIPEKQMQEQVLGMLRQFGILEEKQDAAKDGDPQKVLDFTKAGEELAKDVKAMRDEKRTSKIPNEIYTSSPQMLPALYLFEEGKVDDGISVICDHPTQLTQGLKMAVNFPEDSRNLLNNKQLSLAEFFAFDGQLNTLQVVHGGTTTVYERNGGIWIVKGDKEKKDANAVLQHGDIVTVLETGKTHTEAPKDEEKEEKGETTLPLEAIAQRPDKFLKDLRAHYKEEEASATLQTFVEKGGVFEKLTKHIGGAKQMSKKQKGQLIYIMPGLIEVGDKFEPEKLSTLTTFVDAVDKALTDAKVSKEENPGRQLHMAIDKVYTSEVAKDAEEQAEELNGNVGEDGE